MCVSLFLRLYLLCDNGVYHGHDGDVHNVADGTFDVGEVDRLVQPHLDRPNHFRVAHGLYQFVGRVGGAEIQEEERVHSLALQPVIRELAVPQRVVEGEVHLHFPVYHDVRIVFLDVIHGLVHRFRAALCIRPEIRVGNHGHDRFMAEEPDRMVRKQGYVDEGLCVRMPVYEGVGKEICALLRVHYVHGAEMLQSRTDSYHLLGNLYGVAVFGVCSGDERIGISCLDHHHAEIVRFEHLVAGFVVCGPFTRSFLREDMCIRLSLISDVNVEDDYVEFILNGNAGSFQVKRVTELKCEFLSGKTIFEYEEMKNLSMNVSGYVKYDIDYPEGWTVEFDGTKMSVTAPAAPSEWNQTPFDESGLIKIWLYDNKGDVVFDKVMVQIGGTQMVTLSATMTEGVVNVIAETPYASSFYLGVMKAFSAPFTDFYAKPEVGESYVIWAFQENYGGSVSPEDIITIVYESSDDKVQETLLNSWPFNTDYPTTSDVYSNTNLSPNTKGYVFVVVIDNDGKIGPLQKKEVTTTDVPRDATIGIRDSLVFQGRCRRCKIRYGSEP